MDGWGDVGVCGGGGGGGGRGELAINMLLLSVQNMCCFSSQW